MSNNELDKAFLRYVIACLIAHGVNINLLKSLNQADMMELAIDAFYAIPIQQIPFHEWCEARGLEVAAKIAKDEYIKLKNDEAFL